MCGVLEDSGARALNSFCGDKAASSSLVNSLRQFEKVCEDVDRMLRVQENGTAPKAEVVDASVEEATPPVDAGTEAVNGDGPRSTYATSSPRHCHVIPQNHQNYPKPP